MNIKHGTMLAALAIAGFMPEARAQAVVDLGSAASFAVLAGSAITFTGATAVNGDIGTYPTTTINGIGNATFVTGSNHAGDGITQAAKTALASAYADAAGRAATTIGSSLGGTTLTPGVYTSGAGTFGITGNLTLDGSGVYIFQTATTLDTAISSQVLLINGAVASNVFWQVGSTATFLSSSVFVGNVLANTSINVGTSTTVDGRMLAVNGAVTFDGSNSVGVTAIPEPATTAVLVAGFLGLVTGLRRFRRKSAAV